MDNAEDHVVVNNTAARVAEEDVSPPNTTANEEAARASDGGAEDAVNNTAATMMDGAQDHVEADLFNGGARENPAQRDEDISPCFYIAHFKQTPAQFKVSSSTSCASLLTIVPYLFGMQVGCSIQANWRIKTRYKTILGEDLIVKRFSFADRTIFEVVDQL